MADRVAAPDLSRMLKRIAFFGYGVVCYAFFFGTFLYALSIGPLAHVFVPLFARGRPTPEHALEAV